MCVRARVYDDFMCVQESAGTIDGVISLFAALYGLLQMPFTLAAGHE